jgi:hypothetical protein
VRCFGQPAGFWGEEVHADGLFGTGTFPEHAEGVVHYEESQDVLGISDAIDLDITSVSTCVVRASGKVSCWGDNRYGQLGDGTTETREVPVNVVGLE